MSKFSFSEFITRNHFSDEEVKSTLVPLLISATGKELAKALESKKHFRDTVNGLFFRGEPSVEDAAYLMIKPMLERYILEVVAAEVKTKEDILRLQQEKPENVLTRFLASNASAFEAPHFKQAWAAITQAYTLGDPKATDAVATYCAATILSLSECEKQGVLPTYNKDRTIQRAEFVIRKEPGSYKIVTPAKADDLASQQEASFASKEKRTVSYKDDALKQKQQRQEKKITFNL